MVEVENVASTGVFVGVIVVVVVVKVEVAVVVMKPYTAPCVGMVAPDELLKMQFDQPGSGFT